MRGPCRRTVLRDLTIDTSRDYQPPGFTRSVLRKILFDYIEVFDNRSRHQGASTRRSH